MRKAVWHHDTQIKPRSAKRSQLGTPYLHPRTHTSTNKKWAKCTSMSSQANRFSAALWPSSGQKTLVKYSSLLWWPHFDINMRRFALSRSNHQFVTELSECMSGCRSPTRQSPRAALSKVWDGSSGHSLLHAGASGSRAQHGFRQRIVAVCSFQLKKTNNLLLALQTTVLRYSTSVGTKLSIMLWNTTPTHSAEALVSGQCVGGSGCFHGWGDGAGRSVAQGALPGPLLESRLGQPNLGGACFHHGCTSRTKPGIWEILQREDEKSLSICCSARKKNLNAGSNRTIQIQTLLLLSQEKYFGDFDSYLLRVGFWKRQNTFTHQSCIRVDTSFVWLSNNKQLMIWSFLKMEFIL